MVRDAIFDALASVTGGFRDELVATLAAIARTRGASGALGIALLIAGASWVFGELVSAFNIIWGVEAPWWGGPLKFLRLTFYLVMAPTTGWFSCAIGQDGAKLSL